MIKLNQCETKLFNLLLAMTKHNSLDVTLRVAGGWVRDKLLDRPAPVDIDIALDTMMGEKFADLLHHYLQMSKIESHGFGVIKKNPEKSKHLETATIKIFDYWIDFVNLRGEEYAEDSRIPLQTIGTPDQDAYRRDFTINSLFYNINTQQVEDFTKKGLKDLENGFIRTPLDPYQTFLDDPLRILRGFRFAARFGFAIDKEALNAANQEKIKEFFLKKISKERIGKEFYTNFMNHQDSKDYFKFFYLLHESNYWPIIIGSNSIPWIEDGYADMKKVNKVMTHLKPNFEYIMENEEITDITKKLTMDEFVHFTLLSVFTLKTYDKKLKDHRKQFAYTFISESLKLGNKYAEFMVKVQFYLSNLKEIVDGQSQAQGDQQLVALGIWQRAAHAYWPLIESLYNIMLCDYDFQGKKCLDLHSYFAQHSLLQYFATKPLLNGTEIKHYFGVDGKQIKEKMDEILVWQLRNPHRSKNDFLKEKKLI